MGELGSLTPSMIDCNNIAPRERTLLSMFALQVCVRAITLVFAKAQRIV